MERKKLQLALYNLIRWNACENLSVPRLNESLIDWKKLESQILSLKYPSGQLMAECSPIGAKKKRLWLTKKEKLFAFGFCIGKFKHGLYFTAD